jgi:transcriptional regulator with XRE-family HTH domain
METRPNPQVGAPADASEADIADGIQLVRGLVAASGTPAKEVVNRLAGRRDFTRAHVKSLIEAALCQGELHVQELHNRDALGRARTRKLLQRGPPPPADEQTRKLTPDALAELRQEAGLSLSELSARLRVRGIMANRQRITRWEHGGVPIPAMHQEPLRECLTESLGRQLAQLRERAGLSQSELGELVGCSGSAISHYERHPEAGPESRLRELVRLLQQMAEAPVEDPGPELNRKELEQLLEAAPIGGKELAHRLGLTYATVWQWRQGRRPIPPHRWRQVRTELENAEPPPKRDRIQEAVLPQLGELLEQEPGLTETEARGRLPYSHPTVRQAIDLGVLEGKIHHALAGPRGWPALFPGPDPNPDQRESRAEYLASIASQLIEAAGPEGIGRKHLHAEMHVAHGLADEAVAIAIGAGTVREEWLPCRDRLGRSRLRLRLVMGA